ncbi:hypothetical protein FAZ19_02445 [Sphingobacterium alkalisoli]|uniref:Uncharacterized protein n=1 Tax=Sphingobacterium alkalisoli TaxID=1874115 RepID=A0A4V5LYX6_9SPHI|nr:hypothetical protein [Sphingobacterium alkalisoli]TJY68139.1 hypothetical protein FAZ19_02445 [Sphingobacterium alkalisoli]GGH08778.1 hypothetical protein GCM10011418_06410 [Sphingobacterium alkalisoli]
MLRDDKNVPESKIQGSGFLNIQWKEGEEGEVLFFNGRDILLGKNKRPIILFTSPNISSLDMFNVGDSIFNIKKLVLNSILGKKPNTDLVYEEVPEWLAMMKNVEEVSFENIRIEGLEEVIGLPIKSLSFKNVIISNTSIILDVINHLKGLEEIHYDETFLGVINLLDTRIKCILIK